MTKYFYEVFSRRKDKYANQNGSKMLRYQNLLFDMICGTTIKRMVDIRYPRIKHYKSKRIEKV